MPWIILCIERLCDDLEIHLGSAILEAICNPIESVAAQGDAEKDLGFIFKSQARNQWDAAKGSKDCNIRLSNNYKRQNWKRQNCSIERGRGYTVTHWRLKEDKRLGFCYVLDQTYIMAACASAWWRCPDRRKRVPTNATDLNDVMLERSNFWIKNAVHAAVKRSEDRKMLQLRTKGQMFTYLKEIKSVFVSLINKECSTPTQQTIV